MCGVSVLCVGGDTACAVSLSFVLEETPHKRFFPKCISNLLCFFNFLNFFFEIGRACGRSAGRSAGWSAVVGRRSGGQSAAVGSGRRRAGCGGRAQGRTMGGSSGGGCSEMVSKHLETFKKF